MEDGSQRSGTKSSRSWALVEILLGLWGQHLGLRWTLTALRWMNVLAGTVTVLPSKVKDCGVRVIFGMSMMGGMRRRDSFMVAPTML